MKKQILSLLMVAAIVMTLPQSGLRVQAEDNSGVLDVVNEGETIDTNWGTIKENNGTVKINSTGATITTNNGTVSKNDRTITTNNGTVNNGDRGIVQTNNANGTVSGLGKVENNYGTVTTNNRVTTNWEGSVSGGQVTDMKGGSATNNCWITNMFDGKATGCRILSNMTGGTATNCKIGYNTLGKPNGTFVGGEAINCTINKMTGGVARGSSTIDTYEGGYVEEGVTITNYAEGKSEADVKRIKNGSTPPCSTHTLETVVRKEPTCTTPGVNEYYHCTVCFRDYSDKACQNEITDLDAWKTGEGQLATLPHSFTVEQHDETSHWNKCADCDATDAKAAHSPKFGICDTCKYDGTCSHQYGPWENNGDENHKKTCDKCNDEVSEAHEYSSWTDNGDGTHKKTCAKCDDVVSENHKPGAEPTATEPQKCTECGAILKQPTPPAASADTFFMPSAFAAHSTEPLVTGAKRGGGFGGGSTYYTDPSKLIPLRPAETAAPAQTIAPAETVALAKMPAQTGR